MDSYFIDMDVSKDDFTKQCAEALVEQNRADLDDLLNRHRVSSTQNNSMNIANNLNFRYDFDTKSYLELDANYEYNSSTNVGEFFNKSRNSSAVLVESNGSSNQRTENHMFNFKADYSLKIDLKQKIETGIGINISDREMPYFYYIEDVPDMTRTNHFTYSQQIYYAYATYARSFGKFSGKACLRLEQVVTISEGLGLASDANGGVVYDVSKDLVRSNNYFSAYPSLHLTYQINDKNDISINYSRRASRPSTRSLNPTPMFSDPSAVEGDVLYTTSMNVGSIIL